MPAKKVAKKVEVINIGEVAFLAGILIAVIAGVLIAVQAITEKALVVWTLFGLGILVGLLNIRKEEFTTFLLASLIFILPLGIKEVNLGPVNEIIQLIGVFVLPAALITAFKAVWDTASKK